MKLVTLSLCMLASITLKSQTFNFKYIRLFAPMQLLVETNGYIKVCDSTVEIFYDVDSTSKPEVYTLVSKYNEKIVFKKGSGPDNFMTITLIDGTINGKKYRILIEVTMMVKDEKIQTNYYCAAGV